MNDLTRYVAFKTCKLPTIYTKKKIKDVIAINTLNRNLQRNDNVAIHTELTRKKMNNIGTNPCILQYAFIYKQYKRNVIMYINFM